MGPLRGIQRHDHQWRGELLLHRDPVVGHVGRKLGARLGHPHLGENQIGVRIRRDVEIDDRSQLTRRLPLIEYM